MPGVHVLIVDDQEPFRRAAHAVIEGTGGFVVVAEASSGEDAVEVAARLKPDLVVMDIHLGGIDGYSATRQICAADPLVRVLLVSTYHETDLPPDALSCGAVGYAHKEEFGPTVLRKACR